MFVLSFVQARYKKTELCITCARLKNACQTCILDLQFGLPLAVRDQALAEHQRISRPASDVGRGVMIEAYEKKMELSGPITSHSVVDLSTLQKGSMLERMAKREPYYKRNEAHLCSFYARGECNRGVLCPFRHEIPTDPDLAKQNFKDRYYGTNDPVAKKMLRRVGGASGALVPPEDTTITTLWLGGIDHETTEDELKVKFYPYGELQSIRVVPAKSCAFVTFHTRVAAEEAAKKLADKLQIRGANIKMAWGRPKEPRQADAGGAGAGGGYGAPQAAAAAAAGPASASFAGPPGISRPAGPPPGVSFPAPPPGIGRLHLPAADPRQGATKLPSE